MQKLKSMLVIFHMVSTLITFRVLYQFLESSVLLLSLSDRLAGLEINLDQIPIFHEFIRHLKDFFFGFCKKSWATQWKV